MINKKRKKELKRVIYYLVINCNWTIEDFLLFFIKIYTTVEEIEFMAKYIKKLKEVIKNEN